MSDDKPCVVVNGPVFEQLPGDLVPMQIGRYHGVEIIESPPAVGFTRDITLPEFHQLFDDKFIGMDLASGPDRTVFCSATAAEIMAGKYMRRVFEREFEAAFKAAGAGVTTWTLNPPGHEPPLSVLALELKEIFK